MISVHDLLPGSVWFKAHTCPSSLATIPESFRMLYRVELPFGYMKTNNVEASREKVMQRCEWQQPLQTDKSHDVKITSPPTRCHLICPPPTPNAWPMRRKVEDLLESSHSLKKKRGRERCKLPQMFKTFALINMPNRCLVGANSTCLTGTSVPVVGPPTACCLYSADGW